GVELGLVPEESLRARIEVGLDVRQRLLALDHDALPLPCSSLVAGGLLLARDDALELPGELGNRLLVLRTRRFELLPARLDLLLGRGPASRFDGERRCLLLQGAPPVGGGLRLLCRPPSGGA